MNCQGSMIQLVNFIAILQLLAGLCLLFFYEDLLKKVAVTPARIRCIKNLEGVQNRLQEEFPRADFTGYYDILDCRYKNGSLLTIHTWRNAISYIGKLSFVFLIALMVVASHETVGKDSPICYGWILISTVLFLFLVVWSLTHRDAPQYDRYWNFIISAVILCVIMSLAVFMPFEMPVDKTAATYLILGSFLMPVVLIALLFERDERRADLLSNEIEQLYIGLDSYINWALSPNDRNRYDHIESSLRSHISPDASLAEAEKAVRTYVADRVHGLKETYKDYGMVHRELRIRLRNKAGLCGGRLFIVMLILLYFVELRQLAINCWN